jgi:nitroreductase
MEITRRGFFYGAGVVCGTVAEGGIVSAMDSPGTAIDPDAFLAVFSRRQTVRRYKPDPVPKEHIRKILDAARRGPTCMNQQPWMFLVIQDKAKIETMKKRSLDSLSRRFDEAAAKSKDAKPDEIARRKASAIRFTEGYFTAPVYVVVLVDSESQCSGYALKHDGPIAAAYLMLAARAFGYGTAYLTDGISEEVTREVLAIPARYVRICITPIGIPDGWPKPVPKRELDEMVAYETLEGHQPLAPVPYNP